jgi:hypothetical protein
VQGELYGDCVPVNASMEMCLVYGGGWGQCAALDQFASTSAGRLTDRGCTTLPPLVPTTTCSTASYARLIVLAGRVDSLCTCLPPALAHEQRR